MIALLQRVQNASVTVDHSTVGRIDRGLLIFLGVHSKDTHSEADWLVRKCLNLRIFSDGDGQMNLSIQDIEGEILLVSQFTLYGNANKGNRPSFIEAAPREIAEPLYEYIKRKLSDELGREIASGSFGASMQVEICNDGPVTIWIERPPNTFN
ncbi:MAG: D-aminoacyl-tRNA deacylase [Bacteroidetes bacterium]|nr:D-aminoacyl-tRNA deacylase [Bacteroidota bacterium]MCY4232596.1 D-aminoacyl-tRNA deacylase [Bacteroidota bacterium]